MRESVPCEVLTAELAVRLVDTHTHMHTKVK